MSQICYLLLCHKDPDQVIEQVTLLTSAGDFVSLHFDARSSKADYQKLETAFNANPNVCFVKRVKCGWGEWSLVQGTLNAMRAGYENFPNATHFYMLSGDCMPVKPASYMHQFLDANDVDYIEYNDFYESDWIKVGLKEERLVYHHWFNERKNKTLFYLSCQAHRALGLRRKLPKDLQIMIGSQWWCLRRSTITKLLDLLKSRPDIIQFFKSTWIPDETFFQTLTLHLIPRNEVVSRPLTFLSFTDYGLPIVFYTDHLDFLLAQDHLFARKISSNAIDLRECLKAAFQSDVAPDIGPDGKRLIDYTCARGRVGQRLSERFWERGSHVGRQNTLQIILCKKWHIGSQIAENISADSNATSHGYVFDENTTTLHNMGHLEYSLTKRNRHRRAFLRVLFEQHTTDTLMICLDPDNITTLFDLANDRCELRVLNVACDIDDAYLHEHAQRIGLADHKSTPQTNAILISILRNNMRDNTEQLYNMGLPALYTIKENASAEINAIALAGFLKVPQNRAEKIAASLSYR